MTKHEADVIGGLNMTDQISNEAYKQIMIAAQDENEPCEDCISRQAVLDEMYKRQKDGDAVTAGFIKKLPPVTPQPKMGRWIYDRTRDWDGECKYECSECGMGSDVDYAYCMRCGAKMIEPQERSDKE